MRYVVQTGGSTAAMFTPDRRPALDELPKPLADLILERDRIVAQESAASVKVAELGADSLIDVAVQTDADAAAIAARAGKPVPEAKAVRKLAETRVVAARELDAQRAALAAVTADCENTASDLYWSSVAENDVELKELRDAIEAKAHELADAVEAAVGRGAVIDWLRTGSLDRSAMTWPTEIVDLDRYGLGNHNTSPIKVRGAIVAAATTVLERGKGN